MGSQNIGCSFQAFYHIRRLVAHVFFQVQMPRDDCHPLRIDTLCYFYGFLYFFEKLRPPILLATGQVGFIPEDGMRYKNAHRHALFFHGGCNLFLLGHRSLFHFIVFQ